MTSTNSKRAEAFYGWEVWKEARHRALERDCYLCQDCLDEYRQGLRADVKPAVLVHHIVPRKEEPEKELDLDNLRSLCSMHHEEHHPERRSKGAAKPATARKALIIKI